MLQVKGKGRGRARLLTKEQQKICPTPGGSVSYANEQDIESDKNCTPPKTGPVHVTPELVGLQLDHSPPLPSPFARRPDHGTQGRKIALIVNYYPLKIPSGNVYHYDVEITLKTTDQKEDFSAGTKSTKQKSRRWLNTKKNREIIDTMFQKHGQFQGCLPAYDGQKNLYTRTPLNVAPLTVLVELTKHTCGPRFSGDGDMFEISIKPVRKKETRNNAISLDSIHEFFDGRINEVCREAVMAVETILRAGPCFKFVPVGRSFFRQPKSPQDMHPLSGGKEIWFGHHQSFIVGQWQPMVNINVTTATFRKSGPVINYVGEILNRTTDELYRTPQLRDSDIIRLSKKLSGMKVSTSHLGYKRQYRILKLTREPANRLEFPLTKTEGSVKSIRVSDYFLEKYDVKLRYPHLPCLQVHPEKKKSYFPLEMCGVVEGQHMKERLTESETSKMIKVSSLAPEDRFREIQRVLKFVDFNNDPYNVEFGVRVSSTPLQLEGRVIDPPNVKYLNDSWITPRNGCWEMSGEKFLKCADVNCWMMLSFVDERHCSREDLNRFSCFLCSVARDYGLILGEPERIEDVSCCKVSKVLENVQEKYKGISLVVAVLPGKNSPLYGEIKQVSETMLGLATQCVQADRVKKINRAIAGNICQKINAKMGGVNHSLKPKEGPPIFNKPVIIIGADVTHPSPGSGNCKPSIAAVVGSLDAHPSRYAVTCSTQNSRDGKKKSVEIILDLKNMIIELLKAFYRSTHNLKPEKIIFIRDGVSSGQFEIVRDYELRCIRDACRSMGSEYEPAITFIVVQKRHHTRFIPEDPTDRVGKKGNVPPGTVVDRVACSRGNFDFFLCSHFGLQGTSRPCHYTVISDDSNFSSDEIQGFMYYLCHIYARCTKSISLPSPVMYAHLAAYRCTKYLEAHFEQSCGNSELSEEEIRALEKVWSEAIKVKPKLRDTMYFV